MSQIKNMTSENYVFACDGPSFNVIMNRDPELFKRIVHREGAQRENRFRSEFFQIHIMIRINILIELKISKDKCHRPLIFLCEKVAETRKTYNFMQSFLFCTFALNSNFCAHSRGKIFARMLPEQKINLIEALKNMG